MKKSPSTSVESADLFHRRQGEPEHSLYLRLSEIGRGEWFTKGVNWHTRFLSDVESHRRPLTGSFDITSYPVLLIKSLLSGEGCVYVRISEAKALEEYL